MKLAMPLVVGLLSGISAGAVAMPLEYFQPNVAPGQGVAVGDCPPGEPFTATPGIGAARFCVPHVEAFVGSDLIVGIALQDETFATVGGSYCQVAPGADCPVGDEVPFCASASFAWIAGREIIVFPATAGDSLAGPCPVGSGFGTHGWVEHG